MSSIFKKGKSDHFDDDVKHLIDVLNKRFPELKEELEKAFEDKEFIPIDKVSKSFKTERTPMEILQKYQPFTNEYHERYKEFSRLIKSDVKQFQNEDNIEELRVNNNILKKIENTLKEFDFQFPIKNRIDILISFKELIDNPIPSNKKMIEAKIEKNIDFLKEFSRSDKYIEVRALEKSIEQIELMFEIFRDLDISSKKELTIFTSTGAAIILIIIGVGIPFII